MKYRISSRISLAPPILLYAKIKRYYLFNFKGRNNMIARHYLPILMLGSARHTGKYENEIISGNKPYFSL